MIEFDVGARREADAEQLAGGEKRRLDHLVELKVGFDLTLIEIEVGLAALFGEVAPVPRLDTVISAIGGGERLKLVFLTRRPRHCRLPYGREQLARRRRRLGHRVGKAVGGEILVAEQARPFRTQRHGFGRNGAIVGVAAIFSALRPGRERLLAKVAAGGEGQERLDGGARQRDDVLAGVTARFGGTGGRIDQSPRQAGQVGRLPQNELVGLLVGQEVLAKRRAERRETFADRREARLRRLRHSGTRARKDRVVAL